MVRITGAAGNRDGEGGDDRPKFGARERGDNDTLGASMTKAVLLIEPLARGKDGLAVRSSESREDLIDDLVVIGRTY